MEPIVPHSNQDDTAHPFSSGGHNSHGVELTPPVPPDHRLEDGEDDPVPGFGAQPAASSWPPAVPAPVTPAESVNPVPQVFGASPSSVVTPDVPPMQPPAMPTNTLGSSSANGSVNPMPVVRVLSPVGIEYVFLTIALFTAASGLTSVLLSFVNGKFSFEVLAFPTASLIAAAPVLGWLVLRLKRLESWRPELRLDASKRRSSQFTQIVSFLICFGTVIGVVFSIFEKLGGQLHTSVVKILLDGLVLLVVFGGLLAYYWQTEHKG